MNTIADVVADARNRETVALRSRNRTTPYSYRNVCTEGWKAANLFKQYGAHPGNAVAIAPGTPESMPSRHDPENEDAITPKQLFAILGGLLIGSPVVVPVTGRIDAAVLVGPSGVLDGYDCEAGCSVFSYGASEVAPDVVQFESALWSQNPVEPPESIDPGSIALRGVSPGNERVLTHEQLVSTAQSVVDRYEIDESTTLIPSAPIFYPETVIAGLIAPLLSGATIFLGPPDERQESPVESYRVVTNRVEHSGDEPVIPTGEVGNLVQ